MNNLNQTLEQTPFTETPQKASESAPLSVHPELSNEALPGLVGEMVHLATANSEADPAAVLFTILAHFGTHVGSGCFIQVGETKHPPRLFGAIVGASSRARKGTSTDPVKRFFIGAETIFSAPPLRVSPGPLSSGEGLVYAVRDASDTVDEKTGQPIDPGAGDKRLFVTDGELGSALASILRNGNTLSAILRTAYDSGNISPLTKHSRIQTSNAHIGIIGHITRQELLGLLTQSDIWNGFANRFLWIAVRRQKLVPVPLPMDDALVLELTSQLAAVLSKARDAGQIQLDQAAEAIWRQAYPYLTKDHPGVLGVVTSRAEAQVLRLALIYALFAERTSISPGDLKAAFAAWQYCQSSAEHIFGTASSDPDHNRVLKALSQSELSQTEINALFGGHLSAQRLGTILSDLQACGRISARREGGGRGKGKAKTIWFITPGFESPDFELDEAPEA